jgi:hypothetical protein
MAWDRIVRFGRVAAMRRSISLLAATACGALVGLACSGSADQPKWTEAEAASITTIRGTPVRVRHCRGIGEGERSGATTVYRRFSCLAGARLPHERFDTVAVTYVLRPLVAYSGPSSGHELSDVRFEALQVP